VVGRMSLCRAVQHIPAQDVDVHLHRVVTIEPGEGIGIEKAFAL